MKTGFGVLAALVLIHSNAVAQEHAVGGKAGLLGIGVEYSYSIGERLAVRGMLFGSSYSFDGTESGIDYQFGLNFDSFGAAIDLHPFTGAFRLSAGLLVNDNGLDATSTPANSITIGDTVYAPADVGTLSADIGFNGTAPFVGIGWDWSRSKRFGFSLDLGIVKQGSPKVSLRASGPLLGDAAFAADLAAEEAQLEDSLDDFDALPFASLGFAFRF
jgi:hypothetical protein